MKDAYAVISRRGAAEAGAIFVRVDHLDGTVDLYGPAPQTAFGDEVSDRRFTRLGPRKADPVSVTERLEKERSFDPDLWIVDVEDREGRHFLDVVE